MSACNSFKEEMGINSWKQTKRSLLRWCECTFRRPEDLPGYVAILSLFIHSFMQPGQWYFIHHLNAFTSHKWFPDRGRQFMPCCIASSPRSTSSCIISSFVPWKLQLKEKQNHREWPVWELQQSFGQSLLTECQQQVSCRWLCMCNETPHAFWRC